MADTVSPVGEARQRPTVVTVAVWLLYLVAALVAVTAVVSLSEVSTIADATRRAYESVREYGPDVAQPISTAARAVGIVGGIVDLLIAAGLVVLARLDLAGNHVARILTWVFGGIGVLCCSCGATGNFVNGFVSGFGAGRNGGTSTDAQRVQEQIKQAVPGWYQPTTTALSLLSALALIAVVILLSLPAANRYFRKPEPAAAWPTPGQPGYPAYPQVPGYPQAGQYQWPGATGPSDPGAAGGPGEQRPGDQSSH